MNRSSPQRYGDPRPLTLTETLPEEAHEILAKCVRWYGTQIFERSRQSCLEFAEPCFLFMYVTRPINKDHQAILRNEWRLVRKSVAESHSLYESIGVTDLKATLESCDFTKHFVLMLAIETSDGNVHDGCAETDSWTFKSAAYPVEPSARALSLSQGCHVCGALEVGCASVKWQCGRCQRRRYCSESCQQQDWKEGGHKAACVPAAASSSVAT